MKQLCFVTSLLLLVGTCTAQTVRYTAAGDSAGDWFGYSVAGAGDVNGDGFDDFLVGAHLDDGNGTDSGSVRVFSGADGSVLYTKRGDSPQDYFGFSVAGAGDVNGDGFDDFLVGAYLDDDNGTDSGSARVFSGADCSVLHTVSGDAAGDLFGGSVAGAGDVNGDGFADFLVGASADDDNGTGSGSARVFSGVDGSVLYTVFGDSAGDQFGFSVAGAGDVNGDGLADFVVGANLADRTGVNAGLARVFSGADGSVLYTVFGDSAGDLFGASVSAAGDVNRDGLADFVVGAPRDDDNGTDSGSARVFSGVDGSVLYTVAGDSAFDGFGISVAGAGDVNGDGFDDFVVGLWQDDVNGVNSGSASVFSGMDGSVLYTVSGDSAGDGFGSSVASAGDVNGDGLADLVVGAWLDDVNGTESGSARVFLSDFATLPARVERRGLGCLASNGHLPTTELVGYPYVGQSVSLRLRGALPNALALFVLGSAGVLDLASLGAPGCSLQASLDLIATFVTDANGLVTLNGIASRTTPPSSVCPPCSRGRSSTPPPTPSASSPATASKRPSPTEGTRSRVLSELTAWMCGA